MPARLVLLAGGLFVLAACGEAPPPPPPPRPPPPMESDRDDGVQIDTMGSLDGDQVRRTFQGASSALLDCYQQGLDRLPALAGDLEFHVRVDREGRVIWAFLARSGLGDGAAEHCMLEVVRRTGFPRPRGGEAEATFPISLEPPDAVAYPATWTPDRVAGTMTSRAAEVEGCLAGAAGFTLTLYVAPGGVVRSAGATPPDAEHQAAADCLANAAAAWTFDDPGPAGAKITLEF